MSVALWKVPWVLRLPPPHHHLRSSHLPLLMVEQLLVQTLMERCDPSGGREHSKLMKEAVGQT